MRVYRDEDADLAIVRGRRVAVLGYGNQGRAQALNLRDSGVTELAIGLRDGAPSAARAAAEGFRVMSPDAASGWADLVMMLTPDEVHGRVYAEAVAPHLRGAGAPGFSPRARHRFGPLAARREPAAL